jgi:hypothetical protein
MHYTDYYIFNVIFIIMTEQDFKMEYMCRVMANFPPYIDEAETDAQQQARLLFAWSRMRKSADVLWTVVQSDKVLNPPVVKPITKTK